MAKKWTKTRLEKLKIYLECGISYSEIAKKMKTTPKAVERAVYNHGLKKHKKDKKQRDKAHSFLSVLADLDDDQYRQLKRTAKAMWNVPKTRRKNKKKPFDIYLAISDVHVPEQSDSALKAIFQLMNDVRFDGFFINGDFMDMGAISHWNRRKKMTLENQRMKKDYILGNSILDEFDKRLPKKCDKRYWYGNHEDWYFQLIEETPVLQGLFHPTEELNLKERGYEVYEDVNHIERIGRLSVTHGVYANKHYLDKHINEFKTNVMIGHTHSPRVRFASSPAKTVSIAGYCLGCLCNQSPSFMKNRPNKWEHGFGVIYFYKDGSGAFDVDMKRIVNGKFVYNNKLYDGNK